MNIHPGSTPRELYEFAIDVLVREVPGVSTTLVDLLDDSAQSDAIWALLSQPGLIAAEHVGDTILAYHRIPLARVPEPEQEGLAFRDGLRALIISAGVQEEEPEGGGEEGS